MARPGRVISSTSAEAVRIQAVLAALKAVSAAHAGPVAKLVAKHVASAPVRAKRDFWIKAERPPVGFDGSAFSQKRGVCPEGKQPAS